MESTKKNTVLVVDDEKLNLEVLVKILSDEYTVYLTKNGHSAVEMANSYLPDLILLDIVMPDMDGFEVLETLKASEKTRNIPVIFITGLESVEDEEKGLALEAVDFIHKPFSSEIVKLRVKNQIQIINQIRAIEESARSMQLLHKDLEAAVKAAEDANHAKSAFLARMSHEIRTPLNAVVGISEIQLHNEFLPQDVKEAFIRIFNSGDLLLGIINDILDMSKIEAGKLELISSRYDVSSLINDTVYLNMIKYENKPIEFILNVDENIPAYLFGDELRIKQILNNLLSNAFKYTPAGEVELSFSVEKSPASSSGKSTDSFSEKSAASVMFIFHVRDSGQGMTKEQISKLFEEYSRFNQEANRATEGIGLGMGITQNLIHIMNGEIFVESEVGKGSLFTVRLPQGDTGTPRLGKEAAERLRQFHQTLETKTKKVNIIREPIPFGKVLVVDDIDMNLYVAKGMLSPYGLQIDTATSGFEAIEKIKSSAASGKTYDLVFMDHMMPGMDGVETTREIRKWEDEEFQRKNNGAVLPESGRLPVVALTANAVSGVREMFLANGFNGFISKPIAMQELDNTLKEWLSSEKKSGNRGAGGDEIPAAPVCEKENSVFNAIEKIEDINTEIGLNQLMGNKDLYCSTMDLFNKKIVSECDKMSESLAGNDLYNFMISIHAMKSMLAIIGALSLSETALKLENASRNREADYCTQEFSLFREKLMVLNGQLSVILGSSEEKKEDNSAADENIQAGKVLIVDDMDMILVVIKEKLARYGLQADTAESGLEAIEKIKKSTASGKTYDLVFMDHMMPEMDGVETTSLIRTWEIEEDIKSNIIIALTANAEPGVKEMFINNGFDGYLSKPVVTKELENIFREWLPDLSFSKEAK